MGPRGLALRRGFLVAALILIGSCILAWPALLSGHPSVFYDTDDYYLQGVFVARALGFPAPTFGYDPQMGSSVVRGVLHPDPRLAATMMGGRSPIYGAALFALERLGTLRLLVAAQAAAAAAMLWVAARTVTPQAPLKVFAALVGVSAIGSSLPFFTTFAMPDVFAGLDILGCGLVLFYWPQMGILRRLFVGVVLVFSAASHNSTLALTVIAAGAGAALLARSGLGWKAIAQRSATVLAAAALAVGLLGVFDALHQATNGATQRRPIYLAARVLADGPGRRVLQARCASGQLPAWCAFRKLPLDDAETILTSDNPEIGVIRVSPFEVVRRLSAEEPKLVWLSLLEDPLGLVLAAGRGAIVQLGMVRVEEPLMRPAHFTGHWYWAQTRLPELVTRSSVSRPAAPGLGAALLAAKPVAAVHLIVLAIAAAAFFVHMQRMDVAMAAGREPFPLRSNKSKWDKKALDPRAGALPDRQTGPTLARSALAGEGIRALHAFAWFIVLMIVANALVCGSLSGAYPRYQARIIWLAPMLAVLLQAARRNIRVALGEAQNQGGWRTRQDSNL